jgi:hypothetical protein
MVATGAAGDTNGDGSRDSTNDEFIEIKNNEVFSVDISGWTIKTGTTSPGTLQYTFPASTTLAAGARAVVFGGGTPGGSFGGSQTFVASGLSLSDSPTDFYVTLQTSAGAQASQFNYGTTPAVVFSSGISKVRNPEGTGGFVNHSTVSGNAGIIWSPGVAATAAIPKLISSGSSAATPASGATSIPISTNVNLQFNMAMNSGTDFNNTIIKLFANSDCASSPVALGGITASGTSLAVLNNSALNYSTLYCVTVSTGMRSANLTAITSSYSYSFTTASPSSTPATTMVISEYGGCRFAGSTGGTACGGSNAANDEFVELYNPTASAIDISGWFIQRRTAAGTASCWATIPASTSVPAGKYYLVGGAGYTSTKYAGSPTADFLGGGTSITGVSESIVFKSGGTCTNTTGTIADAINIGAVTEGASAWVLTPIFTSGLTSGTTLPEGQSVERKACYNSTGDSNGTTGMFTGGGHELQGNSEKAGTSAGDWILRTTMNPQNSSSAAETKSCP